MAVLGGTFRLLDNGEFHQVSDLAVEILLRWVLWFRQRLQEDSCRSDILAHVELLREPHAGVIGDVPIDPAHAAVRLRWDSPPLAQSEAAEAG